MERQPLKVFISYTRADDEAYHFAAPLKKLLRQILSGMTSQDVEVFLDRESIALGMDWKVAIEAGVRESMCLLVCYTGAYAKSTACREEFLLFQEEAARAGLPNLMIPLVLLGFDTLPGAGEDAISDEVARRQGIDFKPAWVAGADSPEFKDAAMKLAVRILEVYRQSEEALAAADDAALDEEGPAPAQRDADDVMDDDDGRAGIVDLMAEFEDGAKHLGENAEEFTSAMDRLGSSISDFRLPTGASSPRQVQATFASLANRVAPHAVDMQTYGFALRRNAQALDANLRDLYRVIKDSKDPDLIRELRDAVVDVNGSMSSLDEVDAQMNAFQEVLSGPEQLSGSLRKALRPVRRGVTALRDALTLLNGWRDLEDALEGLTPANED